MATTFVDYTGDGNATKQFTFPSIQESDIKVKVDEVLKSSGTHYNITSYTTTGGGNVVFTSGNIPTSPSVIHIYRDTNVESAKATYQAGASVKAGDLNANHEQLLFAVQEEQNQLERVGDIKDDAITTDKVKDGAINSAKILDGTIVNADVNASAAIAGTKIDPHFGSQNITTTGGIGVGGVAAITGNLDVDGTADIAGNLDCHAGVDVTGNITVTGTVDGRDVSTDGTKLDTIETNAKDDQTAAEIRTLVESATDSNVFTDADHTKLNNIETGATADQTNAEIRAAVEAATDSNVFTDADHSKLNAIEAGATGDQTNAEIRAAVEAATDSNVFTDADHSKLNAIEAGATADQSDAEIKTAYENNSDTNAFTDAEKTKLGNLGSLNALSDVNTSGVADGKILKYDASASEFIIADDGGAGGGGSSTFTGLSDTPANFGGAAGKTLKVNSSGNAVEFVTVSTDIVNDTTPQLGGDLDVQTRNITTSTTNGNVKLLADGTGVVEVRGIPTLSDGSSKDGAIQLNCSQNSHGVKISSPAHSASASYTLTLPTGITAGQPLITDANGNLSWSNNFITTSGGSFTGNIIAGGGITLGNADTIKFDSDDQDTNHISFRGPDALSSTVTYTLPEDGSAGQFLKTDGSGVLSFGTVTTDLVGDTTPQLGGNLDLNGNDISGTGNFSINGNVSGNSLTTNAGNIIINSTAPTVSFVDSDANPDYEIKVNGGEFDIRDSTNSASRLKIGTTGEVTSQGKLNCQAGLDTDGDVVFNSDTTNIGVTFDASTSTLNMSDSQALSFGDHSTTGDYNLSYVNGSDFTILGMNGGSGDLVLGTFANGTTTKTLVSKRSNQALELYFANSKKLETVTGGVTVTGTCTATSFAGDGSNLTGIASTTAGGAIYENSQTISSTHTIPVGSNGMSAGPVTINNGVSLTISNGSTYTIV